MKTWVNAVAFAILTGCGRLHFEQVAPMDAGVDMGDASRPALDATPGMDATAQADLGADAHPDQGASMDAAPFFDASTDATSAPDLGTDASWIDAGPEPAVRAYVLSADGLTLGGIQLDPTVWPAVNAVVLPQETISSEDGVSEIAASADGMGVVTAGVRADLWSPTTPFGALMRSDSAGPWSAHGNVQLSSDGRLMYFATDGAGNPIHQVTEASIDIATGTWTSGVSFNQIGSLTLPDCIALSGDDHVLVISKAMSDTSGPNHTAFDVVTVDSAGVATDILGHGLVLPIAAPAHCAINHDGTKAWVADSVTGHVVNVSIDPVHGTATAGPDRWMPGIQISSAGKLLLHPSERVLYQMQPSFIQCYRLNADGTLVDDGTTSYGIVPTDAASMPVVDLTDMALSPAGDFIFVTVASADTTVSGLAVASMRPDGLSTQSNFVRIPGFAAATAIAATVAPPAAP